MLARILSIAAPLAVILAGCAAPNSKLSLDTNSILDLQIIHIIEPQLTGTRPLNSPRAVAVNQSGDIFIADYGNDRVIKLDSTFKFVREAGGFGAGDYVMNGPAGLAIDKVSNIYVVDTGNNRIVRFDRHLNFISGEDGFTREEKIKFIRPLSIEISSDGDILVGDEGLGACYKLDQFFNYIFEFGGRDEIYSVIYPSSIDHYINKIYVADTDYGYVFIYDDFGMMTQKLGDDRLKKPSAVAASKSGIWITDSDAGNLYCFDFRGREIFRWNGSGEFRLINPVGVFVDHNGRLFVTDSNASRIYVLRPIPGN